MELNKSFELGTLFTTIAGLLNLLVFFDAAGGIVIETEDKKKPKKTADKYVGSSIDYKDGSTELKINGKQINKFVKINKKYKVSLDNDAVKKFIKDKIAKKFGSGDLVVVNSPGSGKIYISDGDGDKVVNVPSEQKSLLEDIKSGKSSSRKPKYVTDFLYSSRGGIIKDDYIDINLSKQHVYVRI